MYALCPIWSSALISGVLNESVQHMSKLVQYNAKNVMWLPKLLSVSRPVMRQTLSDSTACMPWVHLPAQLHHFIIAHLTLLNGTLPCSTKAHEVTQIVQVHWEECSVLGQKLPDMQTQYSMHAPCPMCSLSSSLVAMVTSFLLTLLHAGTAATKEKCKLTKKVLSERGNKKGKDGVGGEGVIKDFWCVFWWVNLA